MSSYIIGLTGGIACGKTNLTDALKAAGAPVVDADEVSRQVTSDGGAALPALREAFGDRIFSGESLNRKALGALVFSNEEKRKQLNSLLHPVILSECDRLLSLIPGPAVYSVPLLYECGLEKSCREVWCAYIPQKEQIRRLMARDGITKKQALQKIRSQWPTLKKARLSHHVIRTDGTREESAQKAVALWQKTLQRLSDHQ
ncbi:MAG: dephospho-CoA kinase [Clostridia bacterium]|nr:dephospho-CoA kinase [Clostridia bacterium]